MLTFHQFTVIGVGVLFLAALVVAQSAWAAVLLAAIVFASEGLRQVLASKEASRIMGDREGLEALNQRLAATEEADKRLTRDLLNLSTRMR